MPRQILALPLLMSLNAGLVDTAGFLALQGLFTAHVTGNFVTFGAAMVQGTSGGLAKLLALPVFCLVVVGTRMFSFLLPSIGLPIFRSMLALKVLLLALGGALAVHYGPFPRGDSLQAICTGMVLVAAMAIQNAAHRIHMGTEPPSTLMTGTTTQIMIDVADVMRGAPIAVLSVAKPRLGKMAASVVAFAVGCAAGACLYATLGSWCFVLPPVIALPAVFLAPAEPK
ncbi:MULTISPECIES: YoaK family protein [unclassified Bradyrhizobium]|jgi:uncharacterized membrane protein YoaK (UPF0700 family)|uniref:YoaK family protein n=1 Tax=unclassified Bradyrhizobium TaxID=2631580 RepID=UPI0010465262|nr:MULTISPECIES: YoaK family protein [unclassified Bradyrhizobium]